MKPTTYVNDIFNSHITSPQLTTTENTITYHNTLCWSLQNFAEELSLVSLGSLNGPKRNWKQCLCKILEWPTKSIMVCYDIFCSGQFAVHRHTYTLVKNNKAVCKAPKKFECQLVTVYSFRESQLQYKFSFLNLRSVPSIFRVFILASIVSFMSLASFSREASIQSSWN